MDASIPAAPGRMMLGKALEEFVANLALWSKKDYKLHWTRELKALFEGFDRVALFVSYDDPEASWNLEIWRVYRDGERAHFQNQLLQYSDLPRDLNILELSKHIKDRVTLTKDGHLIAEWYASMGDSEIFLHRVGAFETVRSATKTYLDFKIKQAVSRCGT